MRKTSLSTLLQIRRFCARAEAKARVALRSSCPLGVMTTDGVPSKLTSGTSDMFGKRRTKGDYKKYGKYGYPKLASTARLVFVISSQFSARPSPWISQLSCNARSSAVPALPAQPLWLSKRCHQRRLSRPNKGSNRAAKRRLVDTEKARYSTGVKVAMQMSQCLQVDWCFLVWRWELPAFV